MGEGQAPQWIGDGLLPLPPHHTENGSGRPPLLPFPVDVPAAAVSAAGTSSMVEKVGKGLLPFPALSQLGPSNTPQLKFEITSVPVQHV